METFRVSDLFESAGVKETPAIVQGNHSNSVPWTLRGLHYQYPNPQGKLVHVTRGKIVDVAVDLRAGSPTYGKHVVVPLDNITGKAVWVPPGFAHGFLALDSGADVQYECTHAYYSDEFAKDLKWDDPDLAISWPIKMGQMPVISQKDRKATSFHDTKPIEL